MTANLVTKRLVFRATITKASRPGIRHLSLQASSLSSFIASVDRKTYDGKDRFFSSSQLLRSNFTSRMRPRLLELCALLQLPHATAAPGGMRVIAVRRTKGEHVGTLNLEEAYRNGLRSSKTLAAEFRGNTANMTQEAASAMPVHTILMDKVSEALLLGSAPATARAYMPQKPNQVDTMWESERCDLQTTQYIAASFTNVILGNSRLNSRQYDSLTHRHLAHGYVGLSCGTE